VGLTPNRSGDAGEGVRSIGAYGRWQMCRAIFSDQLIDEYEGKEGQ
jgi:hypothetical protein